MEYANKTAVQSEIGYYLLRISAIKAEIDNLQVEKETLSFQVKETECDDAINDVIDLQVQQ